GPTTHHPRVTSNELRRRHLRCPELRDPNQDGGNIDGRRVGRLVEARYDASMNEAAVTMPVPRYLVVDQVTRETHRVDHGSLDFVRLLLAINAVADDEAFNRVARCEDSADLLELVAFYVGVLDRVRCVLENAVALAFTDIKYRPVRIPEGVDVPADLLAYVLAEHHWLLRNIKRQPKPCSANSPR